jgi:hypothetical protein
MTPCNDSHMNTRLTETQRLALRAVSDGALDYAHPRTVHSLIAKGLIVYTGSGGADPASYRVTERGFAVLAVASA